MICIRSEKKMHTQIAIPSSIAPPLFGGIKKDLKKKRAKLSFSQFICNLWMPKRTRYLIRAAEISFHSGLVGLTLWDKGEDIRAKLLGINMSHLRWFRHLIRMLGDFPTVKIIIKKETRYNRPQPLWIDYISLLGLDNGMIWQFGVNGWISK